MGLFGSVGQMFDGRRGSPIEDWLRRQGAMGPAATPGGASDIIVTGPGRGGYDRFTPGAGMTGATPGFNPNAPQPPGSLRSLVDSSLFRSAGANAPAAVGDGFSQQSPIGSPGNYPPPAAQSSPQQALVVQEMRRHPEADHGQEGHQHSADYEGHYHMHGRDRNGLFAAQPKRKRSTLDKIWNGIQEAALNYSASEGNPRALMVLKERALERQSRKEQEAAFQEHDRIVGVLMRQGMSADEAELAALNTQKLGEEYNSRFRTREASEGQSIRTPNLDGRERVWTAPKTFQHGADVQFFDPQSLGGGGMGESSPALPPLPSALPPMMTGQGMTGQRGAGSRGFSMRTEAEQYADTIAQRGTPEWGNAVRDYVLKGDGPTAYGYKDDLQDQRLASDNRNTDVRANASVASSERAAGASRYNRDNTPVSRVLNERGEVVLTYPDGRVQTLRNSRPMPTTRGGRAGRGGGSGRAGGVAEGTVIRNPTTGQTMVRRGGRWVAQR